MSSLSALYQLHNERSEIFNSICCLSLANEHETTKHGLPLGPFYSW